MDISTVVGLALGTGFILLGILLGGELGLFIDYTITRDRGRWNCLDSFDSLSILSGTKHHQNRAKDIVQCHSQ